MKRLAVFVLMVVFVAGLWAGLAASGALGPSSNQVELERARSVIEASRAAQEAAKAAQIAANGLSHVAFMQSLMLGLLVVLLAILLGLCVYVLVAKPQPGAPASKNGHDRNSSRLPVGQAAARLPNNDGLLREMLLMELLKRQNQQQYLAPYVDDSGQNSDEEDPLEGLW